MKLVTWLKKKYELLKIKNIAIVAVMITQALKRIVQSELGLIVLDMVPLPWVSLIGKLLGLAKKVNEVLPQVVKAIVISKGILDQSSAGEYKTDMTALTDHLRLYSEKDLNDFLKFMSMEILKARFDDGIIDDNEKSEIIENTYQFLFKK